MSYMTPGTAGVFRVNKYPVASTTKRKGIRGLGDVLDVVFRYVGIKKVVAIAAGGGCGCNKRRKKLNERFPLGKDR